ncbi:MAG TPA: hypothetical protein VLV78_01780 [Thermoanaerobaculia bacterium]|nr:hypothetical protein [Thermoanaerobaculia bacterium]
MTDTENAHQLGEVLFAIKKHERELGPLIVRAKMIGASLASVGAQLEDRPFGVANATESVTPNSVSGGWFGTERHVFDYAVIENLEREIGGHVRELHRLRQLKSHLEP